MDCLKASKIKPRKVGCISFNTTHFARFDFRRFQTVHKASCVRKVSEVEGFTVCRNPTYIQLVPTFINLKYNSLCLIDDELLLSKFIENGDVLSHFCPTVRKITIAHILLNRYNTDKRKLNL
jgi:hypothetical protein